MKFYINASNGERIYIDEDADTRKELEEEIGGERFTLVVDGQEEEYDIYDVVAEKDSSLGVLSATLGLAAGSLAGPVGVMVGGALGTGYAIKNDYDEAEKVRRFNSDTNAREEVQNAAEAA